MDMMYHASMAGAIAEAHTVLWDRFIHPDGLIHDYVGELPTPEDCEQGRPNAIGWWSPIENGPMFTGLYMPAACERARRSGDPIDIEHARLLSRGLMTCASVSDVPGFIVRGVGTDGQCHYPLGACDQTHPWFYGLYAYLESGIPTQDERRRIVAKMEDVAGVLESTGWHCPCDGAFRGQFRGCFTRPLHRDVTCYLFLLLAMCRITGKSLWEDRFLQALGERPAGTEKTRLDICAAGYGPDREAIQHIDEHQLWIYVGTQRSLSSLFSMDTNTHRREYYRSGLDRNAANALAVIRQPNPFDNADVSVFGHADWRAGYPDWFPQKTQDDAEKMAGRGDKTKLGTRKSYEARQMRNRLAGAAIVALARNGSGHQEIEQTLRHYDYTRLNMAEFFFAECAYYALSPEV